MIKSYLGISSAFLIAAGCSTDKKANDDISSQPNIVFILTDDLGYGDIGIFGANDLQTPHIDGIARQGILFTDFYAASPVCSPSRAAFLTGRYPKRTGVNKVFFNNSLTGLPVEEITIADVLSAQGYTCGLFGKWHLGHMHQYMPLQRGFHEFFGIPYSNDTGSLAYFNGNVIESFEVDQTQMTKELTLKSVDFIKRNRNNPFFLFLSHPMPHVPLNVSPEFEGTSGRGLYGDVIHEIDWSVGQVLRELENNGLLENTLIIFTSDNGAWTVMRDHGGSSGVLREGKMFAFEGGVRVPAVAMWKGKFEENRVIKEITTIMDWFSVFAKISGANLPNYMVLDGHDITDFLLDANVSQIERDFLYYEEDSLRGYRKGAWKVKLPYEGFPGAHYKQKVEPHPLCLFNLDNDPGENYNIASKHPEIVNEMLNAMQEAVKKLGNTPPSIIVRTPSDTYHFDYLRHKYGESFFILDGGSPIIHKE
jgi:arylsulfatase A